MPRWRYLVSHNWQSNARKTAQTFVVLCRNLSAARQITCQFRQLLYAQCASYVSQSVIEAEQDHLVMPLTLGLAFSCFAADAVISKFSQRVGKSWIVGRDH